MMKSYLITFNKCYNEDYESLEEEIKRSPEWWSYIENTWIILTNETADEVWERLEKLFPKDGRILIIEVKANCQGWLENDAWKWIEEKMGK